MHSGYLGGRQHDAKRDVRFSLETHPDEEREESLTQCASNIERQQRARRDLARRMRLLRSCERYVCVCDRRGEERMRRRCDWEAKGGREV